MATIGLFGLTPDELQQQRTAELDTYAREANKSNPNDPFGMDRVNANWTKAGYNIGGGIATLLGAKDPAMQKASDLLAIQKNFDPTTVEGLLGAAQEFRAKGYGNEAMQAFAKAQEISQAKALTRKTTAEAASAENKLDLDEKFRKEFAALPVNATIEEKMAVLNKYGGIDAVGKNVQLAYDKEAQRVLDKEKAAQLSEDRRRHDGLMAAIRQGSQAMTQITQGLQQDVLRARLEKDKRELKDSADSKIVSLDQTLTTLDDIANHPGKKDVVGTLTGSVRKEIPGTDAAGFAAKVDTFKDQVFLPMVQQLRGMGALSDAEGKKLAGAVGSLNIKMKPEEFDASVARIKAELTAAREKASQRLTGGLVSTTPGSAGAKDDPLGIRK